ncbi:MAG TPA: ATP-binding protein [Polyangia bacterium]|nr:ATP-binding protein [Polyangia bacterium]
MTPPSSPLPAPAIGAEAPLVRTRDPLAQQACRLLARYLVALPGALEDGSPGADGVLLGALRQERPLPAPFAQLSAAIEAGRWGEELEELGDAFGCDAVSRDVLGLLLAPEIDPETRLAFRRALGDAATAGGVDADAVRLMLDPLGERPGAIADALDADAPLRRFALIEAVETAGRTVLRPARRLARFLFDLPGRFIDESVRDGLREVIVDDAEEERFLPLIAPSLEVLRRFSIASHFLFTGPPGVGQEQLAALLVGEHGMGLLACDLPVLLGGRAAPLTMTAATAVAVTLREARLGRSAPLFLGIEALFDERRASPADRAAALRHLGFERGPVFYGATRRLPEMVSWLRARDQPEPVELQMPDAGARQALWRRELPDAREVDVAFVAQAFAMAPDAIRRAATAARNKALAGGAVEPDRQAFEASCRDETTHALQHLSSRVTVRVSWSDVVLPEETRETLREIVSTGRHRKQVHDTWGFRQHLPAGGGLSVLFSGEPGTGKTLVAGLIARDLGVELYRVDLSRVVSKYVGETEKQLGQIFDEAQAARVALLFDEADSLFARRTDVKSSVDRYANLEVNYLLQKMEEFDGLTILTTNFKKSIDEAFLRRLRFRVDFPFPDQEEQERLWRVLLPKAAEVESGLGFKGLSQKYNMSGGHIRNALVRAAYLAAAAGSPITQAHLERAAAAEYREMGRFMKG